MSKSLVIVESPSKAKTINKYLGKEYEVLASVGHIKDLPKKDIGIDFENDFQPTYDTIPGKEKVIKQLKTAAKNADTIFIATDPDREGEAIGWHIKEELEGKGKSKKIVHRVLFNEITKPAILEAFKKPGVLDDNLVDAQQARRVLDRIVGYKVSPLLWDKVRRGLSAGRVQTVAVRLVVEREREIEAFIKTEYWALTANLGAKLPPNFDAHLYKIEDKVVKTGGFELDMTAQPPAPILKKNEFHITDKEQSDAILKELENAKYVVSEVSTKEKTRRPVPPFITSKLQQEASRKLRFPVKRTMMLAQRLYEGIEIGDEGTVGLITYMRTDSTRVSDAALAEVREFIPQQFGANYLPEKPNAFKSKKDAQDAHEAIRPTSVLRTPDSVGQYLDKDQLALYKLIWQRFVASQMVPAIFNETTIDINAGPKYLFEAKGMVVKFDGFLAVYEEGKDEKDEEDEERGLKLPLVEAGETLTLNSLTPDQRFTNPPPRFTEATLVKTLEEKGIGRPSTYASIMTVIQDREYVQKEEGKFRPTELGSIVNDLLVDSFADLFDVAYTAKMEEDLDRVEEGQEKWTRVMHEFYDKFTKDLQSAEVHMRDVKRQEILTDEVCDKCGAKMAIKFGRFGQFLACTNYPECKNTRELAKPKPEAENGEEAQPGAEELCENCGKPMALKRGRFGQFLACTGYPDCKTTRKITKSGMPAAPEVKLDEICPQCGQNNLVIKQGRFGAFTACSSYPKCKYIKKETIGIHCPKCEKGELTKKNAKRGGKVFYGCSEYPTCDFVSWNKPVSEPCPKCGAKFLAEKTTKRNGTVHECLNEDCDYSIPVATEADVVASDQGSKGSSEHKTT